jgi:uncharacterized protein
MSGNNKIDSKNYKKIKIRTKKYLDGILLLNDYGNWIFLNHSEYEKYLFSDLSDDLYKKLEKNFLILTDNNLSGFKSNINNRFNFLSEGPTLHIVVPTLRCNYTCKYCYAYRASEDDKDKDMDLETMKKTIDFIISSPAKSLVIEFTGGEPLIRFDLIKQGIEYAIQIGKQHNKKIFFSLVSNGNLLTEDVVDYIIKHKIGLCMSLDGPKEIHDANRKLTSGKISSFDDVVSKIKLLQKKEYNAINVLPVVTRETLCQWKEMVDLYISLGIKNLRFKYLSRFGFASNSWNNQSYSAEEYLDAWTSLMDYLIEQNKKGIEITENLATIMLKKILLNEEPRYTELMNPCGAVNTQVLYDYDGKIFSCDEARTIPEFQVGDVFSSSYKDIITCPVTKSLQSFSDLSLSVDDSPFVSMNGLCPLEIYKEEKGFITNVKSNYRFKIHEGMFNYLFDKIIHDEDAKKVFLSWLDISRTMDPTKLNEF